MILLITNTNYYMAENTVNEFQTEFTGMTSLKAMLLNMGIYADF